MTLETYDERLEYLRVDGRIGEETFGADRYLNQVLYNSHEWRRFRNRIITRDNGCDMAIPGFNISGPVTIHHINPISKEDVLNRDPCIFDPNNVVCVSDKTHKAIHYGNRKAVYREPIVRTPNDMCPWKNG